MSRAEPTRLGTGASSPVEPLTEPACNVMRTLPGLRILLRTAPTLDTCWTGTSHPVVASSTCRAVNVARATPTPRPDSERGRSKPLEARGDRRTLRLLRASAGLQRPHPGWPSSLVGASVHQVGIRRTKRPPAWTALTPLAKALTVTVKDVESAGGCNGTSQWHECRFLMWRGLSHGEMWCPIALCCNAFRVWSE